MNGPTRPPLGFPGGVAGPRGFTVAVDRDAAQLALRGPATGAGGGAYLTPARGVELAFDRVGGWLSSMTVAVSEVSGTAAGEAVAWVAGVFGTATAAVIRDEPRDGIRWLTLRARPRTLTALSRLARLDTARITSPVPSSPLWDAEAADLARQAGLPRRLLCAAVSPVPVPGSLAATIPADVMRVLADDGAWSPAGPQPDAVPGGGPPQGSLDLGLVPHGVFRPGLWPAADLAVRSHGGGAPLITVEAAVAPGVTPAHLAGCRARLADAAWRVLATAAFRLYAPSPARGGGQAGAWLRARAELPAPSGLRSLVRSGAAWAEVVGDELRPADGIGLRRVRRALRWADAALRAESRPHGLAADLTDERWARLAALAWDRCRADWEVAGDPVRAALAAARAPAAGRATAAGRPFLAELAGVAPGVLRRHGRPG